MLWRGDIGGAERVTAALAGELRRMGADAEILFVCDSALLVGQMAAESVPFVELGHRRGSQVLAHPRELGRRLRELRPDVVIAVSVGYLGLAIRAAGYRGPLVGIEHGVLSSIPDGSRMAHVKGRIDRLIGVRAYQAEVAISEFMVRLVEGAPHARRVVLIPHGVAVAPVASPDPPPDGELVAGFAGRLFPGKGLDRLIGAVALLARREPELSIRVRVAGDGEMRAAWERLAREQGVAERIEFLGWSDDIAAHWASCHVAVAPNDVLAESFGMTVLEAMASGRAAIVSDRGALAELVEPERTGLVVAAGDERALADALARYARDPGLHRAHGAAARERAASAYSLRRCAERHLALAGELSGAPPAAAARGRHADAALAGGEAP